MISALLLFIVFVVLLFVWAFAPVERKGEVRKEVKEDLNKIKNQINGDE
jgi:sensor domain CHASE-containing protein